MLNLGRELAAGRPAGTRVHSDVVSSISTPEMLLYICDMAVGHGKIAVLHVVGIQIGAGEAVSEVDPL
ncbi:hypothetical protein [Roseomonas sp. CAU 1739]|uniref:hypothetical protein n=1 Tax=Roseomonas sp. CAU 1739 TaxID=3140364 RepID=UPI00325BF625